MKKPIYSLLILGLLAGCNGNGNGNGNTEGTTTAATETNQDTVINGKEMPGSEAPNQDSTLGELIEEKGGISLYEWKSTAEFPNASLKTEAPKDKSQQAVGKVHFAYKVKDYALKQQTPGALTCGCNNSKDGQHIHLILNNQPYRALYKPEVDTPLSDGHYVALSFLSRSYHESIKNDKAYDLRQFTVGNKKEADVDLKAPLLFYSRPKGEYVGEDTKKILLDFFLVNVDLKEKGNSVRATINGQAFTLKKWAPYAITGLPMGETTIKLELLDKDGHPKLGKFTSVERKITLKDK